MEYWSMYDDRQLKTKQVMLTLNFIYQTGSNQQPFQFNTYEVAATSWVRIPRTDEVAATP